MEIVGGSGIIPIFGAHHTNRQLLLKRKLRNAKAAMPRVSRKTHPGLLCRGAGHLHRHDVPFNASFFLHAAAEVKARDR